MEENKLDRIIEVALFNLFTRGKDEGVIRLTNFSFKEESHLAVFSIAKLAQTLFGFKIELNVNPFTYFWNNFKYKYRKICKRTRQKEGIDVKEFIEHIESANNVYGIFETIYINYYKE